MLSQKIQHEGRSRSGSCSSTGLGYTRPAAILAATALALGVGIAALPLPPASTIGLAFQYPTNSLFTDTGLTVQVHASPDFSLPLSNWAVITNLYATNLVLTNLDGTGTNAAITFRIPAPQAQVFYFLTFSNFWGASPPSNVANTPAPVPTNITTQIQR